MAFELLSWPIRKYIRDKGWEQLRGIQNAAISHILGSDDHFILASRTASGKTEAAFLPVLSKVNFNDSGVQVLYISPLIALINDQFYRIEELCKNLEVPVTKWHGEANKALKNELIKHPSGIVLITPESLEAMFVNRPFHIRHLFSNLKFVVVDEIHSFIGTDRGIQLKSILSRLGQINSDKFRIIGLSATIGDYNEAKKFTGNESKTKVLLDRTSKDIHATFRFFKNRGAELPLELLKDLYWESKHHKVLIFPNSRGRAEEIAVKLKKISERVNGHSNYFSHHSSVDREVREYVEYFAKNNKRNPFCISCTSTLELGIDIGTVDVVVQIDATFSIASLIQRVGRSGRKDGESGNLFLYATTEWSLLQSISCWLLYNEGFIDPPDRSEKPYDILVHQALSIIKGHSGILFTDLIQQLRQNAAFSTIEVSEIEEIIQYLISNDLLEKIQNEIIIGVTGEKVVNSRDFYSVFKTERNYKVVNSGNTIGEIPFSPQVIVNENILLSAKIWKIIAVDHKVKKIEVVPTQDGRKPMFFGDGAVVHPRIREKMFEILYSTSEYDFLNTVGMQELESMRSYFSNFKIQNTDCERPLLTSDQHLQFFTFTGTRMNRTIQLLFNIANIKNTLDESSSSFEIEVSGSEFLSKWKSLSAPLSEIDIHILGLLERHPNLLDFSKWGVYLPDSYKIKLIRQKYFDIENTNELLSKVQLVHNSGKDISLKL
jgi:ATP-dependent helicase Lhr and Lhr-like helicase